VCRKRWAFTLVELLVVCHHWHTRRIAAARQFKPHASRARPRSAKTILKQLATAALNYESSAKFLPPGDMGARALTRIARQAPFRSCASGSSRCCVPRRTAVV